jgi:hypothetical protein
MPTDQFTAKVTLRPRMSLLVGDVHSPLHVDLCRGQLKQTPRTFDQVPTACQTVHVCIVGEPHALIVSPGAQRSTRSTCCALLSPAGTNHVAPTASGSYPPPHRPAVGFSGAKPAMLVGVLSLQAILATSPSTQCWITNTQSLASLC